MFISIDDLSLECSSILCWSKGLYFRLWHLCRKMSGNHILMEVTVCNVLIPAGRKHQISGSKKFRVIIVAHDRFLFRRLQPHRHQLIEMIEIYRICLFLIHNRFRWCLIPDKIAAKTCRQLPDIVRIPDNIIHHLIGSVYCICNTLSF